MKKVILSLSVITLLATSCKKEKDEQTSVTPTKENLTGSYMLSKITAKYGSSEEQPVTEQLYQACERDDIYKLNADLTYQVVDAGAKCDTDHSDTWSLTNASTIIIDDVTYTIRKFDGKALELVMDLNGATMIEYYTKQ